MAQEMGHLGEVVEAEGTGVTGEEGAAITVLIRCDVTRLVLPPPPIN